MNQEGISFTLAIDDADRQTGGCTTHLVSLLLIKLANKIMLEDAPLLVRLAPGIPWKTRGNAAVVIRGYTDKLSLDEIIETAYALALEYSRGRTREPGKGPGIALYPGTRPWRNNILRRLYLMASSSIINMETVIHAAEKAGVVYRGKRGVIGAVSSLSALAPWEPYTYELIAYRDPSYWGTARRIVNDPRIEATLPPCVFNNFNLEDWILVAAPSGPDPVLAGFRGSCREWLGCYYRILEETPSHWVLFRSNQHTGIHLRGFPVLTGGLTPYSSIHATVELSEKPMRIEGQHIIIKSRIIKPTSFKGEKLYLAFYRETKPLRQLAKELDKGDILEITGTIRPYPGATRGNYTLAVESIERIFTAPRIRLIAPRCPKCGARMKSMGKNKGYKCPKCGFRDSNIKKLSLYEITSISSSRLTPTPSGIRHLTTPSWASHDEPTPMPDKINIREILSFGRIPPPLSLPGREC